LALALGLSAAYGRSAGPVADQSRKHDMNDTAIVLPGQIEPFTDVFRLELAIYREARGEDLPGKIAAGLVIRSPPSQLLIYGCSWKVS
jgi:hypothetical protein